MGTKKMRMLAFSIWILFSIKGFSQTNETKSDKKIAFDITGQAGVSYAKYHKNDNLFFNMGGPTLKFAVNKINIGFSMYPTLRYEFQTKKCTPTLGTGFSVNYKKVVLLFPMYYMPANNVWVTTVGLAYKFK